MANRLCFIILFLFAGVHGLSQYIPLKCGFDRSEKYNDLIYFNINHSNTLRSFKNRSSLTIPVVFHIVLEDNPDRISDAIIFQKLKYLNQDYQGRNPDRKHVPDAFKILAGNSSIRFCMAGEDVNGSGAVPIIRVKTPVKDIGIKNNLYYTAQGGSDAWDTGRYLNIWIADTGPGIEGLGSAPGQRNPYEDGVVIHPDIFLQDGPCRTLTHEIGHYLGLFHMWNSDGSCEDQDFVKDTPVQEYPYYDCPQTERISCGTEDMYMNFMNYTDPDCMYFFTRGQVRRMEQTLIQYRSKLLMTSTACSPENIKSNIQIYPNPTSLGHVIISLSDNSVAYLKILLYNIQGKLIRREESWISKRYTLELNNLTPGLYVIVINGEARKIIIL